MRQPLRLLPFFLFMAASLLGFGCSHQQGVQISIPDSRQADSYAALQARHTRSMEFFYRLETQLIATATLFTEDFSRGAERELSSRLHWDDAALKAYKDDSQALFGDGTRLLIHAASRSPELARLEPARQVWQLALLDAKGHSASPVEVRYLKHPSSLEQHLFPYLADFGRTYLLIFPDNALGGDSFFSADAITLRLSNTQGSVSMTWDLPSR